MKQKIATLLTMLLAMLPITSCAQTNQRKEQRMENKKTLVAFFSRAGENYAVGHIEKGNTHIIAEMIAAETGGDLFHIQPVTPYPDDYTECTEVAKRELNAHARPAIQGDAAVEDYDIIFIGYPNWWGDMPIKLKSACKGATVLKGLAVRGATAQNKREQARQSVKNWLSKLDD